MKNVSLETVHCCTFCEKRVGCIRERIIEKGGNRKDEGGKGKRKERFSATIHASYESHLVAVAYGIYSKQQRKRVCVLLCAGKGRQRREPDRVPRGICLRDPEPLSLHQRTFNGCSAGSSSKPGRARRTDPRRNDGAHHPQHDGPAQDLSSRSLQYGSEHRRSRRRGRETARPYSYRPALGRRHEFYVHRRRDTRSP